MERAVTNEPTAIGPAFSAGVRAGCGHFLYAPGANGADMPVAVRDHRIVASAAATLTETARGAATPGKPVNRWGYALPEVGVAAETSWSACCKPTKIGSMAAATRSRAIRRAAPQA